MGSIWAHQFGISLWDPYGSHAGFLYLLYRTCKQFKWKLLSKARIRGKTNLKTFIYEHIVTMFDRPGINMGKSIWDPCGSYVGNTIFNYTWVSLRDPYGSHMGFLYLLYQAYKPCTWNFLSKVQIKGKINLQTLIIVHIVTMWDRPGINMGKSIWDFLMGPIWVPCGFSIFFIQNL